MGADISMPEASFCERFSNLSIDFFNQFSKDNTNNNCALKETERMFLIGSDGLGISQIWVNPNTEENHYTEIKFRKNGFVIRIYSINNLSYQDILFSIEEINKKIPKLNVSVDSLSGLYKPQKGLDDDNNKQEFFEFKNSKICGDYNNCVDKEFYLIFKEDYENNDDTLKKEISNEKISSAIKIQKIFRCYINRKKLNEDAIIDTCSVGNNIENNCGLDSVDEGIIIGENDNVDSNSYFSKLSDIGTLKIVVYELSIEDKQEIARLEQRIRNNPHKTKNCDRWRQQIADIRSKY